MLSLFEKDFQTPQAAPADLVDLVEPASSQTFAVANTRRLVVEEEPIR